MCFSTPLLEKNIFKVNCRQKKCLQVRGIHVSLWSLKMMECSLKQRFDTKNKRKAAEVRRQTQVSARAAAAWTSSRQFNEACAASSQPLRAAPSKVVLMFCRTLTAFSLFKRCPIVAVHLFDQKWSCPWSSQSAPVAGATNKSGSVRREALRCA